MNKNNLIDQLSPYLKQHKDNPVFWQIWSKKTLDLAKNQKNLFYLALVTQVAIGVMLWHMKVLRIKKQLN